MNPTLPVRSAHGRRSVPAAALLACIVAFVAAVPAHAQRLDTPEQRRAFIEQGLDTLEQSSKAVTDAANRCDIAARSRLLRNMEGLIGRFRTLSRTLPASGMSDNIEHRLPHMEAVLQNARSVPLRNCERPAEKPVSTPGPTAPPAPWDEAAVQPVPAPEAEDPTAARLDDRWDWLVGTWHFPEGGAIRFRREADGTVFGSIAATSRSLEDRGYKVGMTVMTGCRYAGQNSVWSDYAQDCTFLLLRKGAEPRFVGDTIAYVSRRDGRLHHVYLQSAGNNSSGLTRR